MKRILNFDMDGTLADLYGVPDWLPQLESMSTKPYEIAKPCGNLSHLARLLNKAKKEGFKINIISWGSKNADEDYLNRIRVAKIEWLRRHLKSVKFDKIEVVSYGTSKKTIAEGILFDDDEKVRSDWGEDSIDATDFSNIIDFLKKII